MNVFLGLPWFDEPQPLVKAECEVCGNAEFERRLPLARPMLRLLGPLLRAGVPCHKRDLRKQIDHVTYVQGHFLGFWGLIETMDPRGKHGPWALTSSGRAFIRGLHYVPKVAVIQLAKVVRYEGPPVSISDSMPHKEYEDFRIEYLSAVRA